MGSGSVGVSTVRTPGTLPRHQRGRKSGSGNDKVHGPGREKGSVGLIKFCVNLTRVGRVSKRRWKGVGWSPCSLGVGYPEGTGPSTR